MEVIQRALALPPVMAGETVEACDRHIEAPSRQATEAIPDIASYATKRHLNQAYNVAFSERLRRQKVRSNRRKLSIAFSRAGAV